MCVCIVRLLSCVVRTVCVCVWLEQGQSSAQQKARATQSHSVSFSDRCDGCGVPGGGALSPEPAASDFRRFRQPDAGMDEVMGDFAGRPQRWAMAIGAIRSGSQIGFGQ